MTPRNTPLIALAAIAAAALLSAGSVLAQEATPDTWLQQASATKSRAQVQTELQQARASGLTKAWSAGYMEPLRQSALRATVRAETLRALRSGEVDAINAEAHDVALRPVPHAALRTVQR